MAAHTRDPVSESFDAAAARLLARASRRPGQWTGTRVANPDAGWMAWGRSMGISLLGPDLDGNGQARTRWVRGFVRSVYYVRKWYMTGSGQLSVADVAALPAADPMPPRMSYRVGGVDIAPGGRIVGRRVAIMLHEPPTEAAARDAVQRLPESARIFSADGDTAGRWADPRGRDWE